MFQQRKPFQEPIDKQLGTLLAFIILFQKKIEQLRIKLAGNEEFHSRLAFQFIDSKRKCVISPHDLVEVLNRYSSPISIGQVQAFCRKYTSKGSFSYDQFIKFLTPKTNKILAQRFMIRTYRTGAQLPTYILKLLFQILSTGINMITITQNLRKKIQQNTQLTHIQLLQLFRKCCSSRQKLYYFINASTDKNQQYDFQLSQMDYLLLHVKGNCDLEDIPDHQIKEILCPLDMNFQKTFTKTFLTTDNHNRTDYFRGTKYNNQISNENKNQSNKTVNFLKTNYRQTSKTNFHKTSQKLYTGGAFSKQLFDQLDQNVPHKEPTPTNMRSNFLHVSKQDMNQGYMIAKQQSYAQKGRQSQGLRRNQGFNRNSLNNNYGDQSQISSSVNFKNLYIEKFAKVGITSDHSRGGNKPINLLTNFLNLNEGESYQRPRQKFQDDFNQNRSDQYSQDMSRGSAFVQY